MASNQPAFISYDGKADKLPLYIKCEYCFYLEKKIFFQDETKKQAIQ